MRNKYIKYIIVTLIGILISLSIFSYRNLFNANNIRDIAYILSDGFLLPGVLILGAGLLLLVSNGGMFDIFTYSFKKMRAKKLYGEKRPSYYNSYYDYRTSKEKVPFGFLVIVGGIFFALSVIFNIMFFYL